MAETLGKNGRFECGAAVANIVVNYVESVDIPEEWTKIQKIYLGDSAKRNILLERDWSMNITMSQNLSDSGQDTIRTAYSAGSNIAVKVWPDYANATTEFYTCAYAKVSKCAPKVDASGVVSETVTIDSDGTAMTLPV
jgi:hypothetical protein